MIDSLFTIEDKERENYYNEHKEEKIDYNNYILIVDDITKIKDCSHSNSDSDVTSM